MELVYLPFHIKMRLFLKSSFPNTWYNIGTEKVFIEQINK